MTAIPLVRITAEGKYKGQLARVLPYNGTWCHVEFLNRNISPRDKHFPPGKRGGGIYAMKAWVVSNKGRIKVRRTRRSHNASPNMP
jgi:hypothetical protein